MKVMHFGFEFTFFLNLVHVRKTLAQATGNGILSYHFEDQIRPFNGVWKQYLWQVSFFDRPGTSSFAQDVRGLHLRIQCTSVTTSLISL
ncbi:hypothetical protein Hypma_014388 [Hypsizygus marmoreus]|uniref:Secreted protein n=1 Tax=Hypsizygus marmoreus TaxID=39966 RepID=A0A369JHU5_HYPMA|nr:hypothetical protein Hypma_014388 [Hypsizygus marmoreus]